MQSILNARLNQVVPLLISSSSLLELGLQIKDGYPVSCWTYTCQETKGLLREEVAGLLDDTGRLIDYVPGIQYGQVIYVMDGRLLKLVRIIQLYKPEEL